MAVVRVRSCEWQKCMQRLPCSLQLHHTHTLWDRGLLTLPARPTVSLGSMCSPADVCVVPQFVSVCVLVCAACLQTLTPGVSPQACAGGEEESEEGGGGTAAHLLEALRQFRLHHRGQYRTVVEESLASYHLQGEESGESQRTCCSSDCRDDDGDGQQEWPASHPSPPSPPPSPATLEPDPSQQAADVEPTPPST